MLPHTSAEVRTCYGAREPDVSDWRQLEVQMEQHLSQDERFWEGAADDVRTGGVMVRFGEKVRMEGTLKQIEVFKKTAIDGKADRFQAEKYTAGAADRRAERARARQVGEVGVRARLGRKKLVRRGGACVDPSYGSSQGGCPDWLQLDMAREEYAKGRNMRAAATAATASKCTAQIWARKQRRKVL